MVFWKPAGGSGGNFLMQETYEDLMIPLVHKLCGRIETRVIDIAAPMMAEGSVPLEQPFASIEASNTIASLHRAALRELEERLLGYIYAQSPRFFEDLIIDLFLAMGYGSRRRDLARRVSRSHDGGVDGIIAMDELGLDVVLLQAKRLKPGAQVTASQMRDFIGTLETKRATKGIFVTTGSFTGFARSSTDTISSRIKLVNGRELAQLMIRYNLGVKVANSYVFKDIDIRYFTPAAERT
jgi:restriction system protein